MTRTFPFPAFTPAAGAATLAAAVAVLGLAAGPARASGDGRIEATVSGVSNAQGLVGCALFGSPTGFPLQSKKHALATLRVAPVNGTARWVFERIAPGDYAIAVVHDTNGNEEADTNLLGMPTEGVGASNNVLPRMTAPTFEASRFAVAGGQTARLAISMRY
jgi:uncharacterized protein (DUF2141 family)